MEKLIERFYYSRNISNTPVSPEKMNQVIQVLCNSIKPEKVIMEFADILNKHADLIFVKELVDTLTLTIAASQYFNQFRAKLRGKAVTDYAKDKEHLFFSMWPTWCVNPVSTLILCLMSRNYELSYRLIPRFTEIEMDTEKLIALGNLVQLIESPSF